jgi:hypothetical protein
MPTPLHCNLDYLKRLLTEAIRLHRPNSMEEATMLADIRDYFMYLCLDGLEDPSLARTLVNTFTELGVWLEAKLKDTPVWRDEHTTTHWYMGFIFALEQLLSLRHEIAKLPAEKISREDFNRSWEETARKLGVS